MGAHGWMDCSGSCCGYCNFQVSLLAPALRLPSCLARRRVKRSDTRAPQEGRRSEAGRLQEEEEEEEAAQTEDGRNGLEGPKGTEGRDDYLLVRRTRSSCEMLYAHSFPLLSASIGVSCYTTERKEEIAVDACSIPAVPHSKLNRIRGGGG